MPLKIISFGYRHGQPPSFEGMPFIVIDVRKCFKRNPYHNKKLRKLRGTDKPVQEDILKTPNFNKNYAELRDWAGTLSTDTILCLGCTGGHHRSVYLAELLSKHFNIPVEHRDYDKP